ncbi:Histone H1-delta [Acropora cervicornis]|uniref:Histone H1-delta n=1 Tax=Acropora cervicornis TaxID=6130 RepID=A0AAD9V0Y0_ACRCE|nr:Histone H1-delta [Acropora cervicornis]
MSAVMVKAGITHPKYIDMIVSAVKALAEKNGSSRQAINKYIVKEYSLTDNKHHNAMLKQALQRGSGPNGPLLHNKGKGAAGSFKIKAAPAKPEKQVEKKAPAKKNAPKKAGISKVKQKPTKPAVNVLPPVNAPEEPVKPVKPAKAKVAKQRRAKMSKAVSPRKPKVVKAKKSSKKRVQKK